MRRMLVKIIAVHLVLLMAQVCVGETTGIVGMKYDEQAMQTPLTEIGAMKFGMFIHWGLYAIPAGEWIMRWEKIPVAEYEKLADQFNPVKFNADEWAQLAEDAGMKYLAITSKHHDGFAMFDSKANAFNIVNATPTGRTR